MTTRSRLAGSTSAAAALTALFLVLVASDAHAQAQATASDPCRAFPWDVSGVLSAFARGAVGAKVGANLEEAPRLVTGTAYRLELVPQASAVFSVPPERPTLDEGSQGGLVRFEVPSAGRYLVALSTGHWIDVLEGDAPIASVNFQGSPGCALPRKIVEFDLPAKPGLILQLSGGVATEVSVVIAALPAGR